jgi:hypothetical protein
MFSCISLSAQETHKEAPATSTHHGMKGAHRLTLGLAHTHSAEGKENGEKTWLSVPSWTLNYDYWTSNKWAIGLQTDIILETYVIENAEGVEYERSRPVTLVPSVLFKPGKRISFIAGVGGEFTDGEDFALTRLAIEYGFHIPGNWEVGAAFAWDKKWQYYNTWGLAFTFSKIWPRKHHEE